MVLPSTSGVTQKLPLTTWLTSARTSHSSSGVGAFHCSPLTPATYLPVCSSARSWTLGRSTAMLPLPSVGDALPVAGRDRPDADRQHDRDDRERHVHGLEAER